MIGRGIDISLIAALAVPPGLVLQMVQNGRAAGLADAAVLLTIAFGLVNGWLIAYAESLRCSRRWRPACCSPASDRPRFQLDVVQWSDGMKGFERLGRGTILGIPTSIVMFAIACVVVAFLLRQTRWGAYIYAIGDNPYAARVTGIPSPDHRAQYVVAALIGCFAGLVMAASVNSMPTRIFN